MSTAIGRQNSVHIVVACTQYRFRIDYYLDQDNAVTEANDDDDDKSAFCLLFRNTLFKTKSSIGVSKFAYI